MYWNLLLILLYFPDDMINLAFFNQYKALPLAIIIVKSSLTWIIAGLWFCYLKNKAEKNDWMLIVAISLSSFKIYSLLFLS